MSVGILMNMWFLYKIFYTGIVLTRSYKRSQEQESAWAGHKDPEGFYGASYLLDQISQLTGVAEDGKSCFPQLQADPIHSLLSDFRREQRTQLLFLLAETSHPPLWWRYCLTTKQWAFSFNWWRRANKSWDSSMSKEYWKKNEKISRWGRICKPNLVLTVFAEL